MFSVFSNWKSAKPVFCSEELGCFLYKKTKKNQLSIWDGKFKFAVLWGLIIKPFFHWATFTWMLPYYNSQDYLSPGLHDVFFLHFGTIFSPLNCASIIQQQKCIGLLNWFNWFFLNKKPSTSKKLSKTIINWSGLGSPKNCTA